MTASQWIGIAVATYGVLVSIVLALAVFRLRTLRVKIHMMIYGDHDE